MRSGSDIRARVATEDSLLPSQVFEQGIKFGIDSLFFNNEVLALQKAHDVISPDSLVGAFATTTLKLHWIFLSPF